MQKRSLQRFTLDKRGALLSALFLICAVAAINPKARAQDIAAAEPGVFRTDNFEMSVRAGFGRVQANIYSGSWVPFRITLSNQGPPISGRLVVHSESSANPNPQAREYVKEIQLPTGSRQIHEIAAFLNSGADAVVTLESADRRVAETSIRVERSYPMNNQLEIAVVDTDPTALNQITSVEIVRAPSREPFQTSAAQNQQGQNQPRAQAVLTVQPQAPPPQSQGPQGRQANPGVPGSNRPVYVAHPIVIPPEDLPRDFISYDTLDALVIGDAPLNQLSEEQSRALRLWVASGGLIIVTGGADIAGARVARLDALLPVDALSTVTTSSIPEMTRIYGPLDSNEQLLALASRLRQGGRVLVGFDERPVVAEKNYGSGLVRFLAINPKLNPYRGWAAAKDLWSDLLLPAAETKPRHGNWITFGRRGNSTSSRWGIQSFLYQLAQIEPPSPKYFLLFLLFYIMIVGPINYAVLRWKRRTDLAWLTIPAVVLVFTVVSVTVAQISRGGNSVMADVSLVDLHQQEAIARSTSGLLIMPATKGIQQVTFAGRDTFVNDVYNSNQSSSASASGVIESERGQRDLILRLPMTTWTSSVFQVRSISEGAPLLVAATEDRGTSSVTIKSLAPAPISKAVYLSAAGVSDIFDLEAGGTSRLSLNKPQSLTFTGWYLTELGQGNEASVFMDLAAVLDREIGGDRAITQGFFDTKLMPDALKRLERPLLLGFVDNGPTEIEYRGSSKRRSKAFYIIHL